MRQGSDCGRHPSGSAGGGFGELSDSRICRDRMLKGLKRFKEVDEIEQNVMQDCISVRHVGEEMKVAQETFTVDGRMFELGGALPCRGCRGQPRRFFRSRRVCEMDHGMRGDPKPRGREQG